MENKYGFMVHCSIYKKKLVFRRKKKPNYWPSHVGMADVAGIVIVCIIGSECCCCCCCGGGVVVAVAVMWWYW